MPYFNVLENLDGCSKLLTVVGAYLLTLPIGLQWYWGNVSTYIYSYVNKYHSEVHDMNSPWLLSFFLIVLNLSFFASGALATRIGNRWTAACGILMFDAGIISSYFAVGYMPILLDLTLGIVAGTGTGILFSSGLAFTLEWANQDVGFLTSLFTSSLNIGSVLINQATTYYVNPFNVTPDIFRQDSRFFSQNSIIERAPRIFLFLAFGSFVIQIIGFCLVKVRTPSDSGTAIYTQMPSEHLKTDKGKQTEQTSLVRQNGIQAENNSKEQNSVVCDYSPKQVLRYKVFYVLCVSFTLVEYPYILIANYYKTFGILRIKDDHFFAYNAAFMVLMCACIRVAFGFILDKVGLKSSMVGISAVMSLGFAWFFFTALCGKWFYAVLTVSLASISCAQYSSFMVAMVRIFGARHASSNVGMLLVAGVGLNLIAPAAIDFVLDSLGWFSLFAGGSVLILVELVLITCFLPNM